jgi:hypothetical protein
MLTRLEVRPKLAASEVLAELPFDQQGLVTAIRHSGVLMLAG